MATKNDINKLLILILKKEEESKKRDEVTRTEFNGKLDRIINTLDSLVKKHKDHDCKLAANQAAHDRFEGKFKVIGKKIKVDLTQ